MRWFQCTVAYDVGNYIGWQLQAAKDGVTIQGVIEKALQSVLGAEERIPIVASGRTDAGVHAWGQVISFCTNRTIPVQALQEALNRILPADIRIREVREKKEPFHARFDCYQKTYRYNIIFGVEKNPFLSQYAWHIQKSLDSDVMEKAAQILIGKHNFRRFTVNNRRVIDHENYDYYRTIFDCKIHCFPEEESILPWRKLLNGFFIEVTGDGFLYKMVRMISGALVDIGSGKRNIQDLESLLNNDTDIVLTPAPAHGLFLWQAYYPAAK